MNNVNIIGSGYAVPLKKVTNHDLEARVDTNDEWIVQRTGISSRYVSEEENTSDLGYRAALKAIDDAGIEKESIEAILVATMSPDCFTPSTACLIQEKLGLVNQPSFFAIDINAACSGFVYAFQLASDMLNRYNRILIIGCETISKMIDWDDRGTCVLFGDGAGAMIVEKGHMALTHYSNSIGDSDGALRVDGLPLVKSLQNNNPVNHYMTMKGNDVFRFAVKVMKEAIETVLEQSGLSIEDIDLIIPHQANYRIIAHVAKKMKVDISKFYMNLQEFGNTSAASVPIAYGYAKEAGLIQSNSRIIMVGFGSGLAYGATLIDGQGGKL
ncbi:MAG: beta-ketoacyl-ACP synthase III [Coprobacillus sp.]